MKLAGILIISFILIGLIGSASTSYFLYLNSKDILKQSVYKDLESNSRLIKNNIDSFLEAQKEKVKLISTQEELTPEELTALLQLDSSFWGLFVINSEGIITLSSNKEQEGLNSSEQCYFISAKNQTSLCPVYFVQVPKEYSIPVSTPFHGGVLVGLIKLETLEKIASDKTGLGQTGENLLAFLDDQDRIHYITSRRFSSGEDIQIPKGQLSNTPIYYSLEGKEEFFTNVKDYRNISVIASTKYLNEIQVGMVSKVDEKEVLGAAKIRFLKSSIILGGIITLLVSAGGFFISSQISKPLKDLTSNVKDITQGEFSIKLNKSRIYEVQVLTDSLNRILSSLKLAILRAGLSKREFGIGEAVKAKKKAEEILKEKEFEEQRIFDSLPAGVFYKDKENRFIKVNQTFAKMIKRPKEEIEGKSCFDLFSEEEAKHYLEDDKKVIESGKPKKKILESVNTPKGKIWLKVDKIPYKDQEGAIIGIIGFCIEDSKPKGTGLKIKDKKQK